ncbi:hypothetical protein [Microbacterium schleiferi]|uniref:Major facilitator superfamily (MFS) profile domain-containing protein n=1 Tax=Microbacterium schleiferi TaxID=69362 RepID=A0ABU7V9R5_9MICO|nr:hypothetical protein [Micrococcales bacterium]
MTTPTVGPYWRVIAYGSFVGVALSIGTLNVYYLIFATEYTLQTFVDAAKWGTALALTTSAFVVFGTIALARKLRTRRGKALFVLFSVASPVVGWLLLGILNGLLVSWLFFFGFPLIAVVSGTFAGIVAALAMFFVPQADAPKEDADSTDDPLGVFDSSP